MSLIGENNFDPVIMGRIREDEYESRSGSDNLDGPISGNEQDGTDNTKSRKKKRYHRHTPQQIQELEVFFKECPHPDEKQRLELGRRLSLETKQVKFWFQNRRTQMKTQLERHENMILKQENETLQAKNYAIKKAMQHPICNNCGGPAALGEISYEEHHLRIENARLKDELARICSLADKFLGKNVSPLLGLIPPQTQNTTLDLAVGRNGFGISTHMDSNLPMGLGDVGSNSIPMGTLPPRVNSSDRSLLLDHAMVAIQELIAVVEFDNLWIKELDGVLQVLNYDEYTRRFNPPCLGSKPNGFVTEATKELGMVSNNALALVEMFMDVDQWGKMFSSLVARCSTIEVISTGMGGTRNGALQLMQAEFQVLSPLVPVRQVQFLRFCKQQAEGMWAIVDVSFDLTRGPSNSNAFVSCRRLPSGCIVQDVPGGGYSKVNWVEHSEYDESAIHRTYRPLVSSGMAFGAPRWVATLQRQCDSLAALHSPPTQGIPQGGREQMLRLAQRMVDNFCMGVCTLAVPNWEPVEANTLGPDVKIMTRTSDNPGEPVGTILSAATSVWLSVPHTRLFDFLRDERIRSEWDILSNRLPMQQMVSLPKGRDKGNCVSLLRATTVCTGQNNMVILQETWTDATSSLVVYAPVDLGSIHAVMNGRESTYVALLPSGFVIVPDCYGGRMGNRVVSKDVISGSLLTIGFQILVNTHPTSELTPESVQTVSNLISCTLQRIKDALACL